jgi:FKBP-type peptidyl-prolyl cis-trans isomerase
MRKTLILTLATLILLLLALGGCQEEAPAMQEIEPGLTYADSVVGTGEEVQLNSFVAVHYTGWLYDVEADTLGNKFDSSVDRGEPIAFPLGRSMVIQGWEKGLPGMKVGGHRTLMIGPEMGYGERGSPPVIPANATLKFNIEIVDMPSVEVIVESEGEGAAATAGDQIAVHYSGHLWQNGEMGEKFDSSHDRGQPYRFRLGAGMVIPGWDYGLEGMKVGTKARLIIPWIMAYGASGRPPKIPAKADLAFDVELVEIEGK